jgi:hypothetical protein
MREHPPIEMSEEQKEALVKLAKFALIPALGYLASRQLYIHKERMTAYIQYYKDKGFKIGLARGDGTGSSEFGGVHNSDEDIEINDSNMKKKDIQEATEIFREAQDSGEFEE